MQMVIFTMANGKMIKHMDLVNILILTEPNMKAIGSTTNNMVKAKKNGQMVLSTKVITNLERRMEKVNSYGPIDHRMKVIS